MTDDITPAPRANRPMMIRGLTPSLPERGKIKIGMKGAETTSRNGTTFQPPKKLDHFVVTTLDRTADGNFRQDAAAHSKLGEKPTEIPVRLLYDDPTLNFPTRYAAYNGRTLWCSGDGETASRVAEDGNGHTAVKCPCQRQSPTYTGKDKCKMNGSLGVLIEGIGGVGGVWKFRTTSYNSIVGILSSLAFIRQITGGVLANIPLRMTVRPKQATDPGGKPVTIQVVGVEFAGDIEGLQQIGHTIALDRAKTHVSVAHIEEEARRLLSYAPSDAPLPGDVAADVVEEFYPEQVSVTAAGSAPPRPTREDEPAIAAPFEIVDDQGQVFQFDDPKIAAAEFAKMIASLKLKDAVDGLWESNTLPAQLREREHTDLAEACHKAYLDALKALQPTKPYLIQIPVAADGERSDWPGWGRLLIAAIKTAKTEGELDDWLLANNAAFTNCAEPAPNVRKSIDGAVAKMRALLKPADELLSADDAANVLTGAE